MAEQVPCSTLCPLTLTFFFFFKGSLSFQKDNTTTSWQDTHLVSTPPPSLPSLLIRPALYSSPRHTPHATLRSTSLASLPSLRLPSPRFVATFSFSAPDLDFLPFCLSLTKTRSPTLPRHQQLPHDSTCLAFCKSVLALLQLQVSAFLPWI